MNSEEYRAFISKHAQKQIKIHGLKGVAYSVLSFLFLSIHNYNALTTALVVLFAVLALKSLLQAMRLS